MAGLTNVEPSDGSGMHMEGHDGNVSVSSFV